MAQTTTRVTFFDPTNAIPDLTDWELQSGDNGQESRQQASALKKDGDFLRGARYDARVAVSMTFASKEKSPSAGQTQAWYEMGDIKVGSRLRAETNAPFIHIDNLQVQYGNTALPSMSVGGHYHNDGLAASGSDIGHDACRAYVPSIKLEALEIGCPEAFPNATGTFDKEDTGTFAFTLTDDAGVDIRSCSYQMKVNHVDENTRKGGHLRGDNYDGTETLTIEFTGLAVEGTDFVIGDGWVWDNKGRTRGNTTASTSTITLTHHVAHTTTADTNTTPGWHV